MVLGVDIIKKVVYNEFNSVSQLIIKRNGEYTMNTNDIDVIIKVVRELRNNKRTFTVSDICTKLVETTKVFDNNSVDEVVKSTQKIIAPQIIIGMLRQDGDTFTAI